MTTRRRYSDYAATAADGSVATGSERFVAGSGASFTSDAIAARAVASGSAARRRHGHAEDNFREWQHRSKLRFEERMLPAVINNANPHYVVSAADLPGRLRAAATNGWADFEIFPLNEEIIVDSVSGTLTLYSGDAGPNWRGTSSKQLTMSAGQVVLVVKSQSDIAAFLLPALLATSSLTPPVPGDLRPYLGQSWGKRTVKNGYRGAQAYREARGLTRFLRQIDCSVEASAIAAQNGTDNAFWDVVANGPGANYAAARDAILAAQAAYPGVAITDAACIIGSGDLPNLSAAGWLTPAVLEAAYLAFFARLRSDTSLPNLRIWITFLTSAAAPAGTIATSEVNWTITRFVQGRVIAADVNCRRGPELHDIPQPWQDGHNSVHAQSEHAARIEHWIAREKSGQSNGRGVKITGFTRLAAKQFKFTLDRFGGNSSSGLNVNPLWKPEVLPLGFGICPNNDLWATPLEIEDFDWDGDDLIIKAATDDVNAIPVFPQGYNRHASFRPAETVRVWDRNLALSDVAGWQPVQALAHSVSGSVFTPNYSI